MRLRLAFFAIIWLLARAALVHAQSIVAPYGGFDAVYSATPPPAPTHLIQPDTSGDVLVGNGFGDAFLGSVTNPGQAAPAMAAGIRARANGHVQIVGSFLPPTVSSCGTSPTAATGNDNRFTATSGTGTPTSCTFTFGVSFSSTPVCTVSEGLVAAGAIAITTLSSTAMTVTWTTGTNSVPLYVLCMQ